MSFSFLDTALWAAGFVGHVALALVLLMRHRWRNFPVFTCFVVFNATRSILLFLVFRYGTKHGYFLAYWLTGFADYLFQVALILEIAREVLRPDGRWIVEARRAFLFWAVAGFLAAAVLASQIGPPEAKGLNLWEVRITIFTSLLTCGLFLAMSMAANRLGLQRRRHAVALGQGLTVWAFSALLEDFGHVVFGWNRNFVVFVHLRMLVYVAVLVFWAVAFWRPETVRSGFFLKKELYPVAVPERLD